MLVVVDGCKSKMDNEEKKVFDYIENQQLSDLEELNLHLIENKDDSTLYGQDMNYAIFFKLESFLFSNIFHIFVFVFLLLFEASAQNTTQLQILLLLLRLKSKEFRVLLAIWEVWEHHVSMRMSCDIECGHC